MTKDDIKDVLTVGAGLALYILVSSMSSVSGVVRI